MMIKRLLIGSIILLGTLLVLLLYLPAMRPQPTPAQMQTTGEVQIGGPFTLINTRGEEVTETLLLGHYSLIYFGFTYCPDICPLALQTITETLEILGPDGEQVMPVFISLDPERDTPDVVASYLEHFHPRFEGLTGTLAQTTAAAEQYRVYAKKSFLKDADGVETSDYTVDHTGFLYLMNPAGRYADHFSKEATAPEIAERLKQALVGS